MFPGGGHVLGKRSCSREAVMFSGSGQALVCDGARSPRSQKRARLPGPTGQYALYLLGSSEVVLLLLVPGLGPGLLPGPGSRFGAGLGH